MSMATVRTRAGGASRLAAALMALAAPPLLLAVLIGNPLPVWPIDWTAVAAALEAGLVPASVWVHLLAVLAWAAWMMLAVMLMVEVTAVVRDRPSPAGVPRWVRRCAQVLISATITMTGSAQPTAAALSGHGGVMVAAAAPAAGPTGAPDAGVTESSRGRLVTVGEGDSWSGFAADVVGDAALGQALRDANLGRGVGEGDRVTEATAFVEPGWQLLIPTELDPQPDQATAASPAATIEVDPEPAPEGQVDLDATVEVTAGDHFWSIAETTVTEAWDRTPSDEEVAAYWRELIDANRDRLAPPEDPDVIFPGQEFVLPALLEETHGEASPAPVEPPEGVASGKVDGRPDGAVGEAGDEARPGAASDPVGDGHDVSARDAGRVTEPDPPVQEDVLDEPVTAWGVPRELTGGLAAAGILAAGVTALLRRRRQRALALRTQGMRLPTPAPDSVHEFGRLDAAAPTDDILDDLATLLCSIPQQIYPAVVTTDDAGTVQLLFDDDTPVPDPVAPWELARREGAPAGWQATIGATGPERSYGLPLLVTMGHTGSRTLLLNLGAIGKLHVTGSDEQVRRLLHRIAMEVAASPVSGPVQVAVAGDDRLTSWYRVRTVNDGAAIVERVVDDHEHVSTDDRLPQLLICHPGTQAPPVPSAVGGFIGIVAATQEPTDAGSWLLTLDEPPTAQLQLPDGAMVDLDLPHVDTDLIEREITNLNATLDQDDAGEADDQRPAPGIAGDATPVKDEHGAAEDSGTVGESGTLVDFPLRQDRPWCDVRVLGPVDVFRDGTRVEGLTGRPLQVLTYLVAHPEGATDGQLEAEVWDLPAGRKTQRAKAAVIRLRDTLGHGPDGELLLPTRAPGKRCLILSDHVGSDADRALAHLDHAADLPPAPRLRELSAALTLIRGQPYADLPMSWATPLTQHLVTRLQDAAIDVARAHRDAGDHDAAEDAIRKGVTLCPYTEQLYVEWANIKLARGHPEQVPVIRDRLRRLRHDGDDPLAGPPAASPDTEVAFQKLLAGE